MNSFVDLNSDYKKKYINQVKIQILKLIEGNLKFYAFKF